MSDDKEYLDTTTGSDTPKERSRRTNLKKYVLCAEDREQGWEND